MTIDEAIEVLELHNQWRKGADMPMETPIRIGMAIDLVVCELKNLRIAHVSSSFYSDGNDYSHLEVNSDQFPEHEECVMCGSTQVTITDDADICHDCGYVYT